MELSSDMKCIQDILRNVVTETGDFTRINFKGGNEQKIIQVMMSVQQFLSTKRYIEDDKPNREHDKELNEIVLFMAVNTQYKKRSLEREQYKHLADSLPPLSKCVLSNLIFGLNLAHQFYDLIQRLPIGNVVELLDEANLCIKNVSLKDCLQWTSLILRAASKKLADTEFGSRFEDDIDNVAEITNLMLLNLTGFYFQDAKTLKSTQIYQHMGFCLLNLFQILLDCRNDRISMKKFIKNIMRVCTFIVRSVTIDVFCAWAEVVENEEVLQCTIAECAYKLIQKYHDLDDATELVTTLKFLARKPKTIAEKVRNASIETMIKNVNNADDDQQKWFQALLTNFQTNQNKDSLKCIKKWYGLCNEEDVVRLLNIYVRNHDEEIKRTILKCASTLTLEKLMIVSTRHFYTNKFSHVLVDDLIEALTAVMNNTSEGADLTKELAVLFLQNPEQVLQYLFRLCLNKPCFSESLYKFFACIKEISKIDNIGIRILHRELLSSKICETNLTNYVDFITYLGKIDFFKEDDVWIKLFLSLLKEFEENSFDNLKYLLALIKECKIRFLVSDQSKDIIDFCLELIHKSRTEFINFNKDKQIHLSYGIDIILDLCIPNEEVSLTPFEGDHFLEYYVKRLSGNMNISFLETICKEFDIRNYGKSIATILKILPLCVTREWLMVSEELICNAGYVRCVEILSDGMLLLSELVQSQMLESADETMAVALKQCLENYSTVLMQKVLPNTTVEEEVEVNKSLCRLLSKLPDLMKETAGLQLVNLFTERSLKNLARNKDFLCRIMLIKNSNICKALAEKMMKLK